MGRSVRTTEKSVRTIERSVAAPRQPADRRGRGRRASERERSALLALTTGGARDVLAQLLDGDPLDLRTRLLRRTAERAVVLPIDTLVERAAVHCARAARHYRGKPAVDRWVERRLDEVFAAALRCESRRASADGAPLERAADRFNGCARDERDLLWRLAFAGTTLDELAHERGVGLATVAQAARRALDALLAEEDGRPAVSGAPARTGAPVRSGVPARSGAASAADPRSSARVVR